MEISGPAKIVLAQAAERERGNVCPTPGIRGQAQSRLLNRLNKEGLIYFDGSKPYISKAGLRIVEELKAASDPEKLRHVSQTEKAIKLALTNCQ